MRSLVLLSPLAVFVARAAGKLTCYGVSGGSVDGSFVPCDSTAKVSACCASNKAGGDVCLDGGLCLAASGGYSGFIYGNGCTDPTGKDDACPHICPEPSSSFWAGVAPQTYNLLQCNPGVWCCRLSNNSTNCCNDKRAQVKWDISNPNIFLPGLLVSNTLPVSNTTSGGSSGSSSSSASSSTGSCAAGIGASSSAPECKSSTSATTIGAAVGASMGALLLIAIATIIWMALKIKNLSHSQKIYEAPAYSSIPGGRQPDMATKYAYSGPQPTELPGSHMQHNQPNQRFVEAP